MDSLPDPMPSPVHSHFDYAMDAVMVADLTETKLIGSTSTENIGKGYGLNDSLMLIPKFNQIYEIEKFKLAFIKSRHWQYPDVGQRKLLLTDVTQSHLGHSYILFCS